ncbi:ATP-binding cassette domain-containing protein, partial [Nonomuraea sp. SBT364]|uniref:ATP-binding cassette domain-containing protein n=1 Tax=Nonomuraea sp. SBT364 TaxID=1580530 RepID=UPI000A544966
TPPRPRRPPPPAHPPGAPVPPGGPPPPAPPRRTLRRPTGYAFNRPALPGDTTADPLPPSPPRHPLPEPRPSPGSIAGGVPEGVREAARAACADAFVRRLPGGYDTPLADAPMSGGERQRLGLARAFARGERLLVLDDATSSLDTVTERQVARALTEDPRGRTRLIVAHRLATAARADRVIWLDNGAVRATGRHRDLWRDPAYREVFRADASPEGPRPPREGRPS